VTHPELFQVLVHELHSEDGSTKTPECVCSLAGLLDSDFLEVRSDMALQETGRVARPFDVSI